MFGNGTYWWAGLLVFVLFIVINLVVFLLRDKAKVSYTIAWCIACYLFVFKVAEYIQWQAVGEHYNFPLEFSALSYVVYSVAVTFRLKKVQQFPLWAGLMAGAIYSFGFWVSPDSFVITNESLFWHWSAFVNHHLLYFGSILMIANVVKLRPRDWWQQVVGGAICVGYSWVIYLFTDYAAHRGKPLIVQMCDGTIMNFLGLQEIATWHYVVYAIGVALTLALTMSGIFLLNGWQCRRRAKKGLPEDAFPEKWLSIRVDWE